MFAFWGEGATNAIVWEVELASASVMFTMAGIDGFLAFIEVWMEDVNVCMSGESGRTDRSFHASVNTLTSNAGLLLAVTV
jgi:hypothetical protein